MYGDPAQPIPEPLPPAEQKKILLPDDPWTDKRALEIVRSDWAYAESFRTHAHDWRYRNNDELYLAWAGQRYWDGTRVPRSSLGIPVTFTQIESILPKIVPLVANPDSYNFYSETDLGDDEDMIVLAHRELVLKQLAETRFRTQVARAIKSMVQHGNGVLEVGYEDYEEEFIDFGKRVKPTSVVSINHPIAGPMMVPTSTETSFSRSIAREKRTRPYVRYVSMKDSYVDPNNESPWIQDGGYFIKRVYMRAEQLKALKNSKDFKIPDDQVLAQISTSKSTANQDVTKLSAELFRYNMWNPSLDYSSDPSQKRIAVIEYTTNSRKIWWLQGTEYIIYNQKNRYGEINYYSAPYADVLDRWHALSICDVVEGEQRLQQATINARIDELALSIHRPMVKRRGVTIPAYQLKVRPGVVIETEVPEGDIKQLEVQNITQQAFVEVQASELRTQKITGLSDLAGTGTPTAGGNSANRTATGVNTQTSATQDRVNYLVETVEDMLIEPVVSAVMRFNRKFMDTKQAARWLQLDPRFQQIDPVKVMNARVVVECHGAAKLRAKMGFMQIFPVVSQVIFNPELLQMLGQQKQMSLNVEEWMHMIFDSINYSPRNPLFVKMSQEQVQAMNQPPADVMAKLQMQQQQNQSDESIADARLRTDMMKTMMKEFMNAHVANAELDDRHNIEMAKLDSAERQAKLQRANNSGGAGKNKGSGK